MKDIILKFRKLLLTTSVISFVLLQVCSQLLYLTEHRSHDFTMRENYGSIARSTWANFIMLNGEYIWVDFSPAGKCVVAFAALFCIGVFVIPLSVFSRFYSEKMMRPLDGFMDDIEDLKPMCTGWQKACRPMNDPHKDAFYLAFYAHLDTQPGEPITHRPYIWTKWWVYLMTGTAIAIVVVLSSRDFMTAQQLDQDDRFVDVISMFWDQNAGTEERLQKLYFYFLTDVCYAVDVLLAIGFLGELMCRMYALGVFPCVTHIVFWFNFLSLGAHVVSLWPSWRSHVFAPNDHYVDEAKYWNIFIQCIVPLRMFRFICMDEYLGAIQLLKVTFVVTFSRLIRATYALGVVWIFQATMLHMLNKGQTNRDGVFPATAGNYLVQGRTLADRYQSLQSSMQYSLVHLAGDFPLRQYDFISKLVLCVGTISGMATIAVFSGIFSLGFVNYLYSIREEEVQRAARLRLKGFLWAVLKVQRRWRYIRNQRNTANLRRTAVTGTGSPGEQGHLLSPTTRHHEKTWRLWVRRYYFKDNGYFSLKAIMKWNVIVNVSCTVLYTVPGIIEDQRMATMFRWIEIVNSIVYLFEWFCRYVSGTRRSKLIIDFLLLFPGLYQVVRMTCQLEGLIPMSDLVEKFMEILCLLRSIKILDFPLWAREVEAVKRAIWDTIPMLAIPAFISTQLLLTCSSVYVFTESRQKEDHPQSDGSKVKYHSEQFQDLPHAMYWVSHFLMGEWSIVDFSDTGSRMALLICIFGTMIFAIPMNIISQNVLTALENVPIEEVTKKCKSEMGRGSQEESDTDSDRESVRKAPSFSAKRASTMMRPSMIAASGPRGSVLSSSLLRGDEKGLADGLGEKRSSKRASLASASRDPSSAAAAAAPMRYQRGSRTSTTMDPPAEAAAAAAATAAGSTPTAPLDRDDDDERSSSGEAPAAAAADP